ncbi:hypothetical protein BJ170DRAFT_603213 [Xylariales sp. AK1849]|nr:hypothetical protein BJ170DRAFT_603213 [Xylariales sp. AK1849]
MNMSQPQLPPSQSRAFSPPQQASPTPSPTIAQHAHGLQQMSRPRPSPGPQSPSFGTPNYTGSGYNPPGARTPNGLASPTVPAYSQQQQQAQHQHQQHQSHAPQNTYSTSYAHPPQPIQQGNRLDVSNGGSSGLGASTQSATNSTTNHNTTNQHHSTSIIPPPQLPRSSNAPHAYSTASFAPPTTPVTPAPGTMAPPSAYVHDGTRQAPVAPKPAPVKNYAYDMDDTLAGTGINLDEEEQHLNDFEIRTGLGAFAPGGRGSFYGAGPANQPPEQFEAKTQEELAAMAADRAWNEAAHRYGISRAQDFLEGGFIRPGFLHARMSKVAAANNLELNLDQKAASSNMPLGRFSNPNQWEKPEIRVTTRTSPDGTIMSTEGSFLPKDAYLIDQLALLSLATKQHLRELLDEVNTVACHRQQSAHGNIPSEWIDAAEPQATVNSAVSPRTNPLKRSANEISNGLPTPVSEAAPINILADAMVNLSKQAREQEEARLKKRQKRLEQAAEGEKNGDATNASRAGSIAPGTPGSVAPEQGEVKPISKKESKKAAKLAEATSSTVNSTVNQFMGRKAKKYSWMAGGGGGVGSGASMPKGPAAGLPGTPTAGGSSRAVKGPLTQDPSQILGSLREESAKGKNIQLRDWIAVLEQNATLTDQAVLQKAYIRLDRSDWGDKAVIPTSASASAATPGLDPPAPTPTPVKSLTPTSTPTLPSIPAVTSTPMDTTA